MKESIKLSGKQMAFRQRRTSNSIVLLILLGMVVASLFLLRDVKEKVIKSPFDPTDIPTRTVNSYALEAETQFTAGNLDKAITAYTQAINFDSKNAELWSEKARIEAYSSATLASDEKRKERLEQAKKSIETAVKLAPDDSTVRAIYSFVLDWNAPVELSGSVEQNQAFLAQAYQEAVHALQLGPKNTLALAYYAEILLDQQKWVQASQNIDLAVQNDTTIMDVHRIRAIVQEAGGYYAEAINEYKKAAAIYPNLTFLYLRIGVNYRQLRLYQESLTWFEKAVKINEQLEITDPLPYLAIGKTYSQQGEFYIAGLNVKTALKYNPNDPAVYADLGVIYFKSRNYEGSIPALQCAVVGCSAEISCQVRENSTACGDPSKSSEIKGMSLTTNTVVYYYTYGSVLAAMSTNSHPYCLQAVDILRQVHAAFANDSTIISIITPSENICENFFEKYPDIAKSALNTPQAAVAASPTATATVRPTSAFTANTPTPLSRTSIPSLTPTLFLPTATSTYVP
jgi:tetratricopeptide (TPR) repeat protein